jgi:hypothetical protein
VKRKAIRIIDLNRERVFMLKYLAVDKFYVYETWNIYQNDYKNTKQAFAHVIFDTAKIKIVKKTVSGGCEYLFSSLNTRKANIMFAFLVSEVIKLKLCTCLNNYLLSVLFCCP